MRIYVSHIFHVITLCLVLALAEYGALKGHFGKCNNAIVVVVDYTRGNSTVSATTTTLSPDGGSVTTVNPFETLTSTSANDLPVDCPLGYPCNGSDNNNNKHTTRTRIIVSACVTMFLYISELLVILVLPQMIFNFLGLTLFNAFPGPIRLNNESNLPLKYLQLPHLCIRVVTRGLYRDLVQQNVNRNYRTCLDCGLDNFAIEIVTDKELGLYKIDQTRIRELVVPEEYRTSTGAQFKARALQYALEPHVSQLSQSDYIIHLDEETLVTRNSLHGIINFVQDGRHSFGQGLITYANQEIVNWVTTLADMFRVADDMGKLRFQFYAFHKPLFSWKGSYVVTKYAAEQDVSYDHGPDGSVAEDCFFSMMAFKKGYTFDFIQGEMWEKSPFTLGDLLRQRKRWIQGIWLVVHSNKIPIRYKVFLAMSLYAWITLPITTLKYVATVFFPAPTSLLVNATGAFCFAVSMYMYIFGVLKSFDTKSTELPMMFVYLVGTILTLSLNIVVENMAVVWGLIGAKHQFYIVKKETSRMRRISDI